MPTFVQDYGRESQEDPREEGVVPNERESHYLSNIGKRADLRQHLF